MVSAPIVSVETLKLEPVQTVGDFVVSAAPIAKTFGATRLGARLVEIPAGKKGWPFHSHYANDELFVIVGGSGTLRLGTQIHPVKAGDVVTCPAGGPESAHQLIADDASPLRYLAISSTHEPDVMEYPDSGKVAAFAGAAPGGDKTQRTFDAVFRLDDAVDYWDGET